LYLSWRDRVESEKVDFLKDGGIFFGLKTLPAMSGKKDVKEFLWSLEYETPRKRRLGFSFLEENKQRGNRRVEEGLKITRPRVRSWEEEKFRTPHPIEALSRTRIPSRDAILTSYTRKRSEH
jgi:hypothetical protein